MRLKKIVGFALSAALVAGTGITSTVPVHAATVPVPGVIAVDNTNFAATPWSSLPVNVTVVQSGVLLDFQENINGQWVKVGSISTGAYNQSWTGVNSIQAIDLRDQIGNANYGLAVGSHVYRIHLPSGSRYTAGNTYEWGEADSQSITVNVSKVTTAVSISNTTQVTKTGSILQLKKNITITNIGSFGGTDSKSITVHLQKKVKGKWKTTGASSTANLSPIARRYDGTIINEALTPYATLTTSSKSYGNQDFRVVVDKSPMATGAVSNTFTFKVYKSSTTLKLDKTSWKKGSKPGVLTIKSAISSVKTGTASVYDGKKKIGKVTLQKGKATYKLPKSLKKGKHTIKVKFSPKKSDSAWYGSAKASKTITIT